MIIAVDWDGVIHDRAHPQPGGKFGPPIEGARDAIEQLSRAGHEIIIHTVVAKVTPTAVERWLDYFAIPFSYVTAVKPNADVFIDDKAIRFLDWEDTLEQLAQIG